MGSRRRVMLFCIIGILLAGCARILTGTGSTEEALAIMREQNARGCIYAKGKAQPWADVTIIVVGTWGQEPPPYDQCWSGLPSGIP